MSKEEKLLREVALKSLQNSERFIKDAKFLTRKRSSAHAFALAVFAEEELAKAVMYHLCAEGVFGINGKWRKDSVRHDKKQLFASWLAFIYAISLFAEEATEFAKNKAKRAPEKFRQIYERRFAEIVQSEQKAFGLKKRDLYEHLEPFDKLQRKREEAMYVEADLKGNRVISPNSFRKSEANRYISHVEERIDVLKSEIKRKMSPREKQAAISNIMRALDQSTDDQKTELLKWYGISMEELKNLISGRTV